VPLVSFARDLVSGPLPDDGIDVDESAWLAWIAEGSAEADPAAQAEAWADRLRAGDLPLSRIAGPPALSVEGGELLGTVRLAAHHVHLALAFQDALGEARLEAMRELAYGAGHEINNPLANIATRAQTLLLDERDPERRRRLSTIVDQAFRARDLIGGLMLFARPPRPHRVATDIHEMVTTVIDRLAPLAGHRLARLDYGPAPVPVAVDRSQVEEAIRAVVSNALEAVGEGGRVTVSVAAGRTQGVCDLIVSDDGSGIDSATLRRVFDPFFSGREAGRGAGLGLSKAWRFLEANGGGIEIESRPGRGTRVLIRLPLAES
jgi:signal transduction histidine kinase